MSGSKAGRRLAVARSVEIGRDALRVRLSDDRVLELRYADYPFLRDAEQQQRVRCTVDESGTVLFWPTLREGISVAGLLGVTESELEEFAGLR